MADENIVTNIVAKSDFSNLIADLNKVSSALIKLQDQLQSTNKTLAVQADVINRNFATTLRSTGQFSTHFVSLSSDVDKFGMQLEKGQIKLRQFFRVYRDHLSNSGGIIRDLAKQQVQMQNAILQPLGRNTESKYLDKKFWLDASDRLMYEGKAPELSDTKRARMPAFWLPCWNWPVRKPTRCPWHLNLKWMTAGPSPKSLAAALQQDRPNPDKRSRFTLSKMFPAWEHQYEPLAQFFLQRLSLHLSGRLPDGQPGTL